MSLQNQLLSLISSLRLNEITLKTVKNLTNHSVARTSLCFYILGYTLYYCLHSGLGKFTVLISILFHNLFFYIIFKELKLLLQVYPNLAKRRLLTKIVELSNWLQSDKKENKEVLGIVVRSYYLGIAYAVGSHLVNLEIVNHYQNLGAFMKILAFFHYSEFLFTALSNPQNLGLKSFVLNHWGEFWNMRLHVVFCTKNLQIHYFDIFVNNRFVYAVKISLAPKSSNFVL